MLGLPIGTVILVSHSELWHQLFAEEDARIRGAVGEHILAIEHVGSTSICRLSAKPIIDIAIAVREISDVEKCIVPIEDIGYKYRGEFGIPGRHYFVRGEPRTHHLHMVELRSDFWRSHLLFRDYLRQHSGVAEEYEKLKRELAQKYKKNREAYTEGKAAFIEKLLRAATGNGAG
jgi:GrpB-like predicted nucleotidyltransferase (UPF0157 family)